MRRQDSPPIHIFAGEKVCIHSTSPAHCGSAEAARHSARMSSAVVSTGLATTGIGMRPQPSSPPATPCALAATWASASGP